MQKKLFQKPYKYTEALVVVGLFVIIGLLTQIITNRNVKIPSFPYNFYVLLAFSILIAFTHLILRRYYFFQWISTVPVSIVSTAFVCIIVLSTIFLSSNEQKQNLLGTKNIITSWQMVLTSTVLLYNLGLATIRRMNKLNFRNIFFFLNHGGLFIALTSAILGTGDLQRIEMIVYENSFPEWRAKDKNRIVELDIAIELKDFEILNYNAELALFNNRTNKVIIDKNTKTHIIDENKTYILEDFKVKIKKYLPNAMKFEDSFVVYINKGAFAACYVEVYNLQNQKITQGWISEGSYILPAQTLKINDDISLALLQPTPREYCSYVKLYAKDGSIVDTVIKVNKPINFKGWTIYQLSYDENMGKWSQMSTLELVSDPWLPFVYLGIFMMLAGSLLLLWQGKNK